MPKLVLAAVVAALLGACAQTVQTFDPPPARKLDAKTTLETGRR